MIRTAAFLVLLILITGCATAVHKVEEPEFVRGKLHIGMTIDEAVEAWGFPDSVNRSCDIDGCFMQYVYDGSYRYGVNSRYVYFRNNNPNTPNFGYHLVSWSD